MTDFDKPIPFNLRPGASKASPTTEKDLRPQPMWVPGPLENFAIPARMQYLSRLPKAVTRDTIGNKPVDYEKDFVIATDPVDVYFDHVVVGIKLKGVDGKPYLHKLRMAPDETKKTRNDSEFIEFTLEQNLDGGEIIFPVPNCEERGNVYIEGDLKLVIKVEVKTGILWVLVEHQALQATPLHWDDKSYDVTVEAFHVKVVQAEPFIDPVDLMKNLRYKPSEG